MTYSVIFTPSAMRDLVRAKDFYSKVDVNLGKYCLDSLILDAERLAFFSGIHPKKFGYYRMLARNFPFSIYYTIHNREVLVSAFIDNRQNPEAIMSKLLKL